MRIPRCIGPASANAHRAWDRLPHAASAPRAQTLTGAEHRLSHVPGSQRRTSAAWTRDRSQYSFAGRRAETSIKSARPAPRRAPRMPAPTSMRRCPVDAGPARHRARPHIPGRARPGHGRAHSPNRHPYPCRQGPRRRAPVPQGLLDTGPGEGYRRQTPAPLA